MISISLDATLIDKARLKPFKRRNGDEGKSLELVLIPTPNGEYGDFIVKQSVTKAEREAGVQLPILGNGKHLQKGGGTSLKHTAPAEKEVEGDGPPESDDVPF